MRRSRRSGPVSLDGQLEQSSKSPRADSDKVARVQRRLRFPRYRRSECLWATTLSLDPPELDNLYFGARAIWQRAYFYPISTSRVLHEMALIIVHRSSPPIRRGQAITLDLGKLRVRLRSPGSCEVYDASFDRYLRGMAGCVSGNNSAVSELSTNAW
jgi:hypothetical protein